MASRVLSASFRALWTECGLRTSDGSEPNEIQMTSTRPNSEYFFQFATEFAGFDQNLATIMNWNFSLLFKRQDEARHLLPMQREVEAHESEDSLSYQEDSLLNSNDEIEKQIYLPANSFIPIIDLARRAVFTVATVLIPGPFHGFISSEGPIVPKKKSKTAYLDGLRGIAAFIVYIDHFSAPHLHGMLDSYGSSPDSDSLLQLPIIRLLYAGSPMVCIFFVISGTALSLKPLAFIRAQNWDPLSQNLTSSIFRRAIRLFLPTTLATFLIMIMVQMGFYTAIYPLPENPDFIQSHPTYLSFFGQLEDWITYLLTRLYYPDLWFQPHPSRTEADYAPQLWTIEVEFYSSMVLFATLAGLSRTRAPIRNCVVAMELAFCLYIGRWDISLFLSGILIAAFLSNPLSRPLNQLQNNLNDTCNNKHQVRFQGLLIQGFWALTMILSLIIASYTSNHGTSKFYLPLHWISHSRWTWEAAGSALLVLSITKLPILQHLLECSVPQYLGRISYPLYIVHFPILSAGGWSLLPWVWELIGKEGWKLVAGYVVAFLLLTPMVFWVSDLWSRLVDDNCVKFGRWVEEKAAVAELKE